MNARIVSLDPSAHQAMQELLPWYVTGTLSGDELAQVQEHLDGCKQCQSDVDWQRKLQAAVNLPARPVSDVEQALAKLRPQLDASQRTAKRRAPSEFLSKLMRGNQPWMRWALAAQLAVIVGLSVLLMPQYGQIAAYRALGLPKNTIGNVVVVFKPETTEQELRRILHASGARVVDGPTVTDAYLLKVADPQLAQALKALHSEPNVVLAESLNGGGGH